MLSSQTRSRGVLASGSEGNSRPHPRVDGVLPGPAAGLHRNWGDRCARPRGEGALGRASPELTGLAGTHFQAVGWVQGDDGSSRFLST